MAPLSIILLQCQHQSFISVCVGIIDAGPSPLRHIRVTESCSLFIRLPFAHRFHSGAFESPALMEDLLSESHAADPLSPLRKRHSHRTRVAAWAARRVVSEHMSAHRGAEASLNRPPAPALLAWIHHFRCPGIFIAL